MTSGNIFPKRFTKIDDLTRSDHHYLTSDDICYFIGEYTARKGYAFSTTNNLILNFKKRVDRRGKPEWQYKTRAIREAANAFRTALGSDALDHITFVPVPPSKAKNDQLYDDRLTKMLRAIRPTPPLDIRELIVQKTSTESVHDTDQRPTPDEIKELYEIDEKKATKFPENIAIVDDVLTTGAHFRAAQSILSARFPQSRMFGLFLSRRVPETSDINFVNIDLSDE